MDVKFWFWIAIIVGSFIANAIKKKREQDAKARPKPVPDRSRKPVSNPSLPAPMSFEELLAEIQGKKKPAPLPAPTFEENYDLKDYDDEAIADSNKREKEAAKYNYRKDDKIYEVYDNAKKQAFERKSLEETLKLEDTDVKFKAFKGYEKQVVPLRASAYAKDLRSPDGLRRAFVLSEILGRRF